MTEPAAEHLISNQSQGDDVAFQESSIGGSSHSCLRFNRVALSAGENCEITEMGMEERRTTRRSGSWVSVWEKGGLVI